MFPQPQKQDIGKMLKQLAEGKKTIQRKIEQAKAIKKRLDKAKTVDEKIDAIMSVQLFMIENTLENFEMGLQRLEAQKEQMKQMIKQLEQQAKQKQKKPQGLERISPAIPSPTERSRRPIQN